MEYLKFTPELAHDWKNALSSSEPYLLKRVLDSMNRSQLESKLWIVNELSELMLFPKSVALLGGWYANYIVPLLIEHGVELIHNFEIDEDAKAISYKFNKTYKDKKQYKCDIVNTMFDSVWNKQKKTEPVFDFIINTSCEHMFPMRRFRELNKKLSGNPIYVLQSTNEDKYEDHINCVSGPEELAEQAELIDVVYSGTKVLDNGMNRFMVIGR
jgi:hypothetical protein